MHGLAVLTLRVDNLDGLVLRDEHALVTHLTTHLAVERRVVEHQFIELVLLLRHLPVSQDVAGIFGVVIANEHLLIGPISLIGPIGPISPINNLHPVAILDGRGVPRALLLFLHLGVKRVLVDSKAVLAADKLRQVERETVGVEQTEGFLTAQLIMFNV